MVMTNHVVTYGNSSVTCDEVLEYIHIYMRVRNGEEEELAEEEKKMRGRKNGKIGMIGVSAGEEEEGRKREGGKEPDQKRPSSEGQNRRNEERGKGCPRDRKDGSVRGRKKDIKSVVFRIGKCIAPSSVVFSNSPAYQSHPLQSALQVQLNMDDRGHEATATQVLTFRPLTRTVTPLYIPQLGKAKSFINLVHFKLGQR